MLDFEEIYKKHGEAFLCGLLDQWERHFGIRHTAPLALEDRWAFFLSATSAAA